MSHNVDNPIYICSESSLFFTLRFLHATKNIFNLRWYADEIVSDDVGGIQ